jgi:hypothetical protein
MVRHLRRLRGTTMATITKASPALQIHLAASTPITAIRTNEWAQRREEMTNAKFIKILDSHWISKTIWPKCSLFLFDTTAPGSLPRTETFGWCDA